MALVVNRERDTCVGRPFSSPAGSGNTFLDHFYNWITRSPVENPVSQSTGGPGWYIIEDGSNAANNPYIVISNHQAANVASIPNRYDEPHKIIEIRQPDASPEEIHIKCYLWWDVSGSAPSPEGTGYFLFSDAKIYTKQDSAFLYDFRGGPNFLTIGANNNTLWSFAMMFDIDDSSVFVEAQSVAALLSASVAQSIGTPTLLTFATAGEAQRFTAGKKYFICNADANGVPATIGAEYVTCTKAAGDPPAGVTQIQVDQIQTTNGFPAGTVIGSYPHRYFATQTYGLLSGFQKQNNIPYVSGSIPSRVFRATDYHVRSLLGFNEYGIGRMSPDDNGDYAYENPYVVESNDGLGSIFEMNRTYGPLKEIYLTSRNGLTQMQVGRVIDSLNYMYMESFYGIRSINTAMMVPDYDAT